MDQDIESVRHDPARLQTLRDTGLLDSEAEEQFDRLTRIASRLLGVPATFFSLVDEDRDFYKSCFGFEEPLASKRELTGPTFCHYSLVSDGVLAIPDTRADPVYRDVPTVESLGVAAYLGVPVHAPDGAVLGSFCAIDMEPHEWTPLEIETMKELGKSAEREVEIRHWMRRQRELMDQEFAARVDLETVMDSRARLMRGFTHDVKNPLGAADGFLALMEDEVLGPVSAEHREGLRRARRALRSALSLIDDLVQIARAETGELEVQRRPMRLDVVAREISEEYRAQAESRGLTLECGMGDDIPMIENDPDRVRQVLSNLLSNAVKYTDSGRVVIATGTRARRDAGGDVQRWAVVDVIDTGPGIAADQVDSLFHEFTRLHGKETEGTGLGLSIAKRVAEALDGMITVESEVGHGSTFTLWLPSDRTTTSVEQPSQS